MIIVNSAMFQNLIDRLVLAVYDKSGFTIDHVSFEFNFSTHVSSDINVQQLHILEEEYRSVVLKLGLLDAYLQSFPPGQDTP